MKGEWHMRRFVSVVFVCLVLVASSGCISMSRGDKGFYREIEAAGLDVDAGRVKSPIVAASLNLLPGFGNFYLAIGTDQGSQAIYGFLNFLVWPYSVLWGVPQAGIDARTINKLETVYYYRYDSRGKAEFSAAAGQR